MNEAPDAQGARVKNPRTTQELREYAADYIALCSRFRSEHGDDVDTKHLLQEIGEWLKVPERDFYFVQINRDMLLCVKYDDAADGVDAWRLRVMDSVDVPGEARAGLVEKLSRPRDSRSSARNDGGDAP